MPDTPSNVKDSSSEEELIKAKMAKLTRTNWVQWSCQFENFLISKGMEDLFDFPSDDTKKTTNLKKMNSGALTLLCSSLSAEFEGVLLNKKSSFYDCWMSLGSCCGKNSIVVICRTLQKLVNLKFEPFSSLEKHVDEFHKVHASYLSISADSTFIMNLSSSIAVAFFLQSLETDRELSSLCQTMYDIKPFDLNTITNRVAIEHSHFQSSYDHASMFDKNKQADMSKPKKKNQLEEPKDLTQQSESDSKAFIFAVNALIEKCNQGSIYLDSSAGRTVVNQLLILEDPKPVKKQSNTFSNPVKVAHQETVSFEGVKIYPVYYVP
ncbi:hypothetical protein O181_037994, partial [Austropuccinia psidii MF-1]|nr:hypothetical protein [Austropuccinia psidii MF-1]